MPFIRRRQARPNLGGEIPARLVIGRLVLTGGMVIRPPCAKMRTPGNTLHESVSSAFPFNLTSSPDLIFRFPLPLFLPFARDGEKHGSISSFSLLIWTIALHPFILSFKLFLESNQSKRERRI